MSQSEEEFFQFEEDDFGENWEDDQDIMAAVQKKREQDKQQGDFTDSKLQEMMMKFQGSGSSTGSKRLCEELRKVDQKEEGGIEKGENYQVELVDDNLYHWRIKIKNFPDDCKMFGDLKKWAGVKHGENSEWNKKEEVVTLDVMFPKEYPFDPPFIRVVTPRFVHMTGHITMGGSICMEVLTPSGWVPSYCLENLLVQIKAEIVEGGARIDMSNSRPYGEAEAREAFQRVGRRYGWI